MQKVGKRTEATAGGIYRAWRDGNPMEIVGNMTNDSEKNG
jgi:hypothetical protein